MGSGFECMECGHRFRTVAAARRALDQGCPKCGGSDVDLERVREVVARPAARAIIPTAESPDWRSDVQGGF